MTPQTLRFPMHTARTLVLAVFFVVTSWGAPALAAAPDPVAEDAAAYPAQGQPLAVTLLAPGDAPHAELRWAPTLGATRTMVMDVVLDIVSDMGQGVGTQKIAMTMALTMDGEVIEADAKGKATVRTTISRAKFDIPALEAMGDDAISSATDALQSMTLTTTTDAMGRTSGTTMKGSPMAEQMMASVSSSFDHMSMAWPTEPIGVGAQWETRGTVNANGMLVQAKTVYTLVAFDPTSQTGKVRVKVSQKAGKQKVPMPMGKATLSRLVGAGSGEVLFDLSRPGMVLPTLAMKVSADMKVTAMGQTLDMGTTTHAKVKVAESKALTPPPTP